MADNNEILGEGLSIDANARLPSNNNFLFEHCFKFQLERLPNTTFFCQSVNMPGMSIGVAKQPTRFGIEYKWPGNVATIEDLRIGFVVDEDLANYIEIRNWMRSILPMNGFDEMLEHSRQYFSEATLFLLNSAKQPNKRVQFKNCFPVNLSGIQFSSTNDDDTPKLADCTFMFSDFEIEDV